jgi:hypothetical protein
VLTGHRESLIHEQPLRIACAKVSGENSYDRSITDLLQLFAN